MVARATARRPSLLVLTDVHYPGWKAYVDGREADVERVDYLLRGVALPAGSHDGRVRLRAAQLARGLDRERAGPVRGRGPGRAGLAAAARGGLVPQDTPAVRSERMRIGLGVAAIAAVYVGSRLWFGLRFPYFFDEGTYATFAVQGSNSTDALFVSLTIAREPLQIWLSILAIKLGFDPLTAGRVVSGAAGLATVGVIGLLGRRVGGPAVGWASAALAVIVPFFVVHHVIGIYEPLVTLILAAALLAQIELARRPRLAWGAVLGAILAAGVLTKRNTLPAVALLPLGLLLLDLSPEGRRRRVMTWLGGVAIALVAVGAAMLVLRASAYWSDYETFTKVGSEGVGFAGVRPLDQVLSDPFRFTGQAWDAYRPALLSYVTLPLLALALAGRWCWGGRGPG